MRRNTTLAVRGQRFNTNKSNGPIGAGGLMAKFTRFAFPFSLFFPISTLLLENPRTSEWRLHSPQPGKLNQYLTTCVTGLLPFARSWALTLSPPSSFPCLFIQGISQGLAAPLPCIQAPTICYRLYHHRLRRLCHLHRQGIPHSPSRAFSRGCGFSSGCGEA